jgi:hypothetical protein
MDLEPHYFIYFKILQLYYSIYVNEYIILCKFKKKMYSM